MHRKTSCQCHWVLRHDFSYYLPRLCMIFFGKDMSLNYLPLGGRFLHFKPLEYNLKFIFTHSKRMLAGKVYKCYHTYSATPYVCVSRVFWWEEWQQ